MHRLSSSIVTHCSWLLLLVHMTPHRHITSSSRNPNATSISFQASSLPSSPPLRLLVEQPPVSVWFSSLQLSRVLSTLNRLLLLLLFPAILRIPHHPLLLFAFLLAYAWQHLPNLPPALALHLQSHQADEETGFHLTHPSRIHHRNRPMKV